MSKKYTQREIELDKLILDKNNPRFAELYSGSEKERIMSTSVLPTPKLGTNPFKI